MKIKESLQYEHCPSKYIYGMCEMFEGPIDKGIQPETTINLISDLGCGSMRVWMHAKNLVKRQADSNSISFIESAYREYKSYIALLKEKGIHHIVSMNHSYIFPLGFSGNEKSEAEIPVPGTKEYSDFLNLLSDTYELLASGFPEIPYWEIGNEVNLHRFLCKPNFPWENRPGENDYDESCCYTFEEKAQITADLCYYANRGVKRGNPNAYVVFPSPTPYWGYTQLAWWFGEVYKAIESGDFPRGLTPDTDTDNYFQVLAWHPYNFGGEKDIFVTGCNEVYDVCKAHGDDGKKVFFTEFGYHDFDFVKERNMTKTEADEMQASFFKTDFKAFLEELPFVESVHIFRLFDWVAGPGIEIDFGMFTSTVHEEGIVPKAKGLALYKLIQGEDADTDCLYRYAKPARQMINAQVRR